MLENIKIDGYTYATRYIASWLKVGGQLRTGLDADNFFKWLLSTGVSENEAYHIKELATNGKMELEYSARIFLHAIAE